jgi:hypothetical protein
VRLEEEGEAEGGGEGEVGMIYLNTVIRRKCYYESSILHPNRVYVL